MTSASISKGSHSVTNNSIIPRNELTQRRLNQFRNLMRAQSEEQFKELNLIQSAKDYFKSFFTDKTKVNELTTMLKNVHFEKIIHDTNLNEFQQKCVLFANLKNLSPEIENVQYFIQGQLNDKNTLIPIQFMVDCEIIFELHVDLNICATIIPFMDDLTEGIIKISGNELHEKFLELETSPKLENLSHLELEPELEPITTENTPKTGVEFMKKNTNENNSNNYSHLKIEFIYSAIFIGIGSLFIYSNVPYNLLSNQKTITIGFTTCLAATSYWIYKSTSTNYKGDKDNSLTKKTTQANKMNPIQVKNNFLNSKIDMKSFENFIYGTKSIAATQDQLESKFVLYFLQNSNPTNLNEIEFKNQLLNLFQHIDANHPQNMSFWNALSYYKKSELLLNNLKRTISKLTRNNIENLEEEKNINLPFVHSNFVRTAFYVINAYAQRLSYKELEQVQLQLKEFNAIANEFENSYKLLNSDAKNFPEIKLFIENDDHYKKFILENIIKNEI